MILIISTLTPSRKSNIMFMLFLYKSILYFSHKNTKCQKYELMNELCLHLPHTFILYPQISPNYTKHKQHRNSTQSTSLSSHTSIFALTTKPHPYTPVKLCKIHKPFPDRCTCRLINTNASDYRRRDDFV